MTQVVLKTLQSVLVFIFSICLILIFTSLGSISSAAASFIRIAMSTAVVVWVLIRLIRKDLGQVNFIFPWLALFLVWLGIQALGQWFGLEPFFLPVSSWDTRLNLGMMFVTAVGFYLVSQEILSDRRTLLYFIQLLVILSTMLALYAIFVVLTSSRPEYFWQTGELPFVEHLWPWLGSSIYPNYLVKLFYPGAFYALSLVFYVHTLRDDSRHLPTHYSWILLNLCFACVLIGAVLLTRSRAGIVALGAALFLYSVCFTFSHQRRRKALKRFGLFFAAVVFFLLTLGLKGVITELQTIFSALTHEVQMRGIRALTIGAGLQLIKESGLLGVGLGNFQMGWIFHHTPPFDHLPGTTFNDFIWLWAETGFPGIFFFAGALLCFIARALKKAFATNDYFISYFLLASVFSLLALSGHALVDPAFYVAPVLWLAFSVLGMGTACLCVTSEIETPPAAAPHGLPAKAGRNSAVAILAFIVLFMAVASGWFSVQKLRASLAMKEARDEQSIKRAMKLDPLNSSYSEMLASFYFREYEKNKNPEFLNESLAALDKAIRLDLFRYALDVQRAGILFEAGDERGVRETFDRLRERLPDFYLAELAASIFYMERAVQLKNNPQTGYFEDLAINHYHQVIELYPGFPEAYKIYNLGSSGASQHFQKLKKEGRI